MRFANLDESWSEVLDILLPYVLLQCPLLLRVFLLVNKLSSERVVQLLRSLKSHSLYEDLRGTNQSESAKAASRKIDKLFGFYNDASPFETVSDRFCAIARVCHFCGDRPTRCTKRTDLHLGGGTGRFTLCDYCYDFHTALAYMKESGSAGGFRVMSLSHYGQDDYDQRIGDSVYKLNVFPEGNSSPVRVLWPAYGETDSRARVAPPTPVSQSMATFNLRTVYDMSLKGHIEQRDAKIAVRKMKAVLSFIAGLCKKMDEFEVLMEDHSKRFGVDFRYPYARLKVSELYVSNLRKAFRDCYADPVWNPKEAAERGSWAIDPRAKHSNDADNLVDARQEMSIIFTSIFMNDDRIGTCEYESGVDKMVFKAVRKCADNILVDSVCPKCPMLRNALKLNIEEGDERRARLLGLATNIRLGKLQFALVCSAVWFAQVDNVRVWRTVYKILIRVPHSGKSRESVITSALVSARDLKMHLGFDIVAEKSNFLRWHTVPFGRMAGFDECLVWGAYRWGAARRLLHGRTPQEEIVHYVCNGIRCNPRQRWTKCFHSMVPYSVRRNSSWKLVGCTGCGLKDLDLAGWSLCDECKDIE